MGLTVYNTLRGKKEEFQAMEPGKVRMYVCGVTVYDDPHVGHARCYVAFDAIVRHFQARGYEVEYVRNFTDVDDKIIKRAAELGIDTTELARRYMDSFSEDMESLGVLPATDEPRATKHIAEIIAAVAGLIEKGHAYAVDGDVYFAVRSFEPYGKLSHRDLDDMRSGARIEVDERKRDPSGLRPVEGQQAGRAGLGQPLGHRGGRAGISSAPP